VCFQNFEAGEFLLHHFEQSRELWTEFPAELFGRVRNVRVVVPLNCTLEMVRDSESQYAGYNSPPTLQSDPLLGGKTSKDDEHHPSQSYRPGKPW